MTTTVLHLPKVRKSMHEKVAIEALPKLNWKLICFLAFSACFLLLVFYVWQINSLTGGSYAVSEYEKQISQLDQENKNLQVSFAESSFLGQVLTAAQKLDFQKVTSVKYVQIPDNAVALVK